MKKTIAKAPRPRSRKKKPLVRGEPVIKRVLAVTLDELAKHGFASFRVEDVAARAGVNKTTVYRRWPTKAALVRAALLTIVADDIRIPDTGSMRGDLIAIGHQLEELTNAAHWQSVIRMIATEGPDSELGAIAQSVRESYEPLRRDLVSAAVARGEVASLAEGLLILEVFDATLHFRLFFSRIGFDAGFLERLVGLLLKDAADGRGRRARKGNASMIARKIAVRHGKRST